MVSHPRRQQPPYLPPGEPEVSDSDLSGLRAWISDCRHLVQLWRVWLAMWKNPVRIAAQQFVV